MKLLQRSFLVVAWATIADANCGADNCLRALRATQTPGRLEAAQSFCATFTTAPVTATASIPTYAIANCAGNIASRVSSACSCLPTPTALPYVSSEALQKEITSDGLLSNLDELYKIALANGGQRAFGFPGFAASRDFIKAKLEKFSSTSISWLQDFPALFTHVESISLKITGVDYYVFGLTYSPSTPPEGITAPLVLGIPGAAGCNASSYATIDVKDKIVIVERGTCPTGGTLAGRVRPAAAAGAAAVIIWNNVPTHATAGTLSAPDPENFVPAGWIDQVDGLALKARLDAGEAIEAYFQQTQIIETRITQNVFAETKGGDPNNVIMLGAHLDSVPAGPGINDDGSGTSLILEVFEALQKFNVKNKVRFAWWGAEEIGKIGSTYYTANLNASAVDQLLAYLNFDMVSRGYFGVFDGDGSTHGLAGAPGSEVIEKLFVDDLTSKGLNVTPAVFTGGSDYATFMTVLKKPVGGLHTGTGVEQDNCYHQACDTYNNANSTIITVNAKTAAHVLSILATEGEKIIPKTLTSSSSVTGAVARAIDDFEWTVFDGERHIGSCAHEE
ncbi:hypothetical protein B0O99DRAFT_623784 [Bisporella sp. PMI_857]|nr:hypothetical protein B0O99DRAFT_623784 [Bisporella sp. PMI_857]